MTSLQHGAYRPVSCTGPLAPMRQSILVSRHSSPGLSADQIGGAVVQLQTRPDEKRSLTFRGGDMRPDHPGQAITVAECQYRHDRARRRS